jgi:MYXO-CTERM domain-containing protein
MHKLDRPSHPCESRAPSRPAHAVALALRVSSAAALLGAALAFAPPARALPGFIAGKGSAPRVSNSTQVVLLQKGAQTVVTVWADYEGPLDRFAIVLPVPEDVALRAVRTLKRDSIDHLDEISAPRFHEFWEKDPCEPGEAQQEWERDLRVKDTAANFLGGGMPDMSGGQKLPPEMLLDFEPQFKDGEYTFSLVPKGQSVQAFLQKKGLTVPSKAASRVGEYEARGMQMLVAEVNVSKVELGGARRALLSPIRFATRQPYALPATLGLANSAGQQELVVYVLHPDKRFEVKNYANVYPPTNVNVDMAIKERMGEFYAGLHDALLAKDPKAFLVEYAWPTIKQCGEPCPNAPLGVHELLSLGVDVVEGDVPKAERNPKPPVLSDEEKAQLKAADKPTKKRLEQLRREAARRRGVLERNSYVITRLHHRYGESGLPEDVELAPASNVQGGLGVPAGPDAELPAGVQSAAESRLQIRFAAPHPNKKVSQCENPVRWRWGQPPPEYRGLRKTWTARDLAYKKRDKFALNEVILSDVPVLGISTKAAEPQAAVPSPAAAEKESGCSLGGGGPARWYVNGLWGALLVALGWRRRVTRLDA